MSAETPLDAVDRALLSLRRFLDTPRAVDDAGTRVELSTLLVLDAVGEAGATVRDVATRLAVAHSTASRLVTRAEQAGAVERTTSPADARETLAVATSHGRALRGRAVAFRHERLARLTTGWTPEELATFADLLTRFAARADGRED
ncbi:MarR family winged helix-turn-helix transcriptional regulator [Cellulosimicrobium marinum]|uniref:MarR family winged helix-turn-helix transcriptional regulator n=1 Tax=Cellulosimicrobium marinum TaxID=1638992 RepID=UPI001E586562|nr:MarR family winged helix-turn-helix transcriptional regulator [Cellulosimicrobium marinum]MCB7135912.1 MarR family winged helix-turn-helix transcriptional regulator [Cellulosimicrobium marinum]